MKVIAVKPAVNDGDGNLYTTNETFDVDDERGEFLLSLGVVERVGGNEPRVTPGEYTGVDAPEVVEPPKRKPGRPRKTAE